MALLDWNPSRNAVKMASRHRKYKRAIIVLTWLWHFGVLKWRYQGTTVRGISSMRLRSLWLATPTSYANRNNSCSKYSSMTVPEALAIRCDCECKHQKVERQCLFSPRLKFKVALFVRVVLQFRAKRFGASAKAHDQGIVGAKWKNVVKTNNC